MKSKPSKQKTNFCPEVNKEANFLLKRGVKVYPNFIKGKWYIEWESNGKIDRFKKTIMQNEINVSLALSIKYLYNKQLENEEKGKNKF